MYGLPPKKCHSAQTSIKFKKAICRWLNMLNVEDTQMTNTPLPELHSKVTSESGQRTKSFEIN